MLLMKNKKLIMDQQSLIVSPKYISGKTNNSSIGDDAIRPRTTILKSRLRERYNFSTNNGGYDSLRMRNKSGRQTVVTSTACNSPDSSKIKITHSKTPSLANTVNHDYYDG